MEKPEKLFPNGPEWEEDGCDWRLVGHHIWLFPVATESGRLWSAQTEAGEGAPCSAPATMGEAIAWLRKSILTKRDELIRVTGDG